MDEKIRDKLDRYIIEVSKVCKVEDVYLFGSSASGDGFENSDLDLAIVSEVFNEDNHIDYMTRFLLLSSGFGLNVEPHLFNKLESTDDFFEKEVVSKGIRLMPSAA